MKLTIALVVLGVALLALPLAVKRLQERPQYIKVRVLDRFTITVHRDSFPDADFLNGLLLAAGCGLATMAALLVSSGVLGGGGELRRFFLVSAIGLGALAVEETFELSESVAYRAGIDARRTDLLFPLIAAVFLVAYRRILRTSRRAILVGGVGAAVFVAAVFLDDAFPNAARAEDPLESVATLLLLSAYTILTLELLGKRPQEVVL